MHSALSAVQDQLKQIIATLKAAIPNDEPFGTAHNHWGFPGLTRTDLIAEAQGLSSAIEDCDEIEPDEQSVVTLKDYVRRLQHLTNHTVPQLWANAGMAVPAYMLTLDGLRKVLATVTPSDAQNKVAASAALKSLLRQVRGMESQMKALEPRTASISDLVTRIEDAHATADQLPSDLASLEEARGNLAKVLSDATKHFGHIEGLRSKADVLADKLDERLRKSADDAKAVLDKCETAYSAATSVGLAGAFTERSDKLNTSIGLWVAGLVAALVAGSIFGSIQLKSLANLLKLPDTNNLVVTMNVLLSFLSVGAPVWFAWLATKQIGHRFRLAEDYAFKASVSRAYEGFRREAARLDPDMEARVLSSALSRLDELPLRLIDPVSHGSPWHELATSETVKSALNTVPEFASQIKVLAEKALATTKASGEKAPKKPPIGDDAGR
jgi:hypothetical protein